MYRILVVEDNAEGAEALRQYLEFRGFGVDVAPSGEEALSRVRDGRRYDVVISDMNLPGLRGDQLAPLLAQAGGGRTRFIGLTGDPGGAPEGVFDEWFAKPCKPARLLEAITRLLS